MIFCWWAFHFFHNCSFFINIFYSNVMIVFVFLWKEIYFQHFITIFFSFFGIYYTDLGTDLQYLMEKTKVIETHASDKKNCFCLKRRSIFLFKKNQKNVNIWLILIDIQSKPPVQTSFIVKWVQISEKHALNQLF